MKTIKKLITHSLCILLVCVFYSCSSNENDVVSEYKEPEPPKRMNVLETTGYFSILEVDGHEYITARWEGGIVHSESCPHNAH